MPLEINTGNFARAPLTSPTAGVEFTDPKQISRRQDTRNSISDMVQFPPSRNGSPNNELVIRPRREATHPHSSSVDAFSRKYGTNESAVDSNSAEPKFEKILESAPPANLIYSLRGASVPTQLSLYQINLVNEKMARFHEDVLTESPFIDVHGRPVEMEMTDADLSDWTDPLYATKENIPESSKAVLRNIFEDYPSHRQWQADHLEVRAVKSEDVPSDQQELVDQEGVFAKNVITKGTVVFLFEGMLLEDKNDIEKDKSLRKLASCDKYYAKPDQDKIIEGMGRSMKLNAATGYGWMWGGDKRNNLKASYIQATRKSIGETIKIIAFHAAEDIQQGEQICFAYDIGASRP